MYYLHLKFDNCGLISSSTKKCLHIKKDINKIGEHYVDLKSSTHDLENPIPYTLLSNVLHVLAGEIPVPTHKKTLLKRAEELDNISKNSFIKYDHKVILNKNGFPSEKEVFRTNKCYWNAGRKDVNTVFRLFDGSFKIKDGFYNWNYFRRFVRDNEDYNKILNFISEFIGYYPLDKTLNECVYNLSKFWGESYFENKVTILWNEISKYGVWFDVLFNREITSTNTSVQTRTPLFINGGILNITYISGEIICPIDNEEIVMKIHNGVGHATLLENGIVYVIGLEKYKPYNNFEETFEKIR